MIGIYFSGTGNSAYCIHKFIKYLDEDAPVISMEDASVVSYLKQEEEIILAYPIYYSNLPKIVSDFLKMYQTLFRNKRIFIIATMGLFSGDGSGCAARLLTSYGATIQGGLHIKMPDCIADEKVLKRSYEKNRELINQADHKILQAANRYQRKNYTKEGLGFFSHIAGLLGQRLWFYRKTAQYCDHIKIKQSNCVLCGLCVKICPMHQLSMKNHMVITHQNCTMCYRCVNACPKQAITLLGKKVIRQHHIEDYIKKTEMLEKVRRK